MRIHIFKIAFSDLKEAPIKGLGKFKSNISTCFPFGIGKSYIKGPKIENFSRILEIVSFETKKRRKKKNKIGIKNKFDKSNKAF